MSHENIVYSKYHVDDEGNSTAGWIGVTLIVLGFILGTVGLFINMEILVWIGAALVPVGAIAWIVLKMMGLGPRSDD